MRQVFLEMNSMIDLLESGLQCVDLQRVRRVASLTGNWQRYVSQRRTEPHAYTNGAIFEMGAALTVVGHGG